MKPPESHSALEPDSLVSDKMRGRLIIFGAGGHAQVVADILRLNKQYEMIGFLDEFNPQNYGSKLFGDLTVLGGSETLDQLKSEGVRFAFIGVGDCQARMRLAAVVTMKGFELATAIHPRAIVADGATVGKGTVVCAGAVVGHGASVGENVFINTCASVDHHCNIEHGVHLAPGVRLGGRVTVEEGANIGIGASIFDKVRIGRGTIIGAGSVITRNVPPGVVAYGVPGRIIRSVEEQAQRRQSPPRAFVEALDKGACR